MTPMQCNILSLISETHSVREMVAMETGHLPEMVAMETGHLPEKLSYLSPEKEMVCNLIGTHLYRYFRPPKKNCLLSPNGLPTQNIITFQGFFYFLILDIFSVILNFFLTNQLKKIKSNLARKNPGVLVILKQVSRRQQKLERLDSTQFCGSVINW